MLLPRRDKTQTHKQRKTERQRDRETESVCVQLPTVPANASKLRADAVSNRRDFYMQNVQRSSSPAVSASHVAERGMRYRDVTILCI